ncbi:MAG: response regulator [Rhodospirillaceae bacterium]|nr:response regulator [Rhodospirillales bacterium]MBT3905928.1 response regulator [Rhodospirillaceae bacterium]MBT4702781.1 response regulator [Rhodospirillaceae bacterium]MBT5035575.1 response regulator [Rhodospirillaceae bacterium]MBT6218311.1 response regulator [Rhodospirillaceae bacterium]
MADLRLDDADILIIDPDRNAANAVRYALQAYGYPDYRIGKSEEDLLREIKDWEPDLIISELGLRGKNLSKFVSRLRAHELGVSPFIPVIGTTSEETSEEITEFNDAGGDEIVTKPLSAIIMKDCIEKLLGNTRPYLVTSTYVGPDRQAAFDDKSGYSIPVNIPNGLGLKLSGKFNQDTYKAALSVATSQVTRYKAESLSKEILVLSNTLLQRLQVQGVDSEAEKLIDRITELSSDTRKRVLGTPYVHVSGVCEALNKTLGNIRNAGKDFSDKDVKLIVPLTQSICLAFSADEKAEAMAKEISSALGISTEAAVEGDAPSAADSGADTSADVLGARAANGRAKSGGSESPPDDAEAPIPASANRTKFLLRLTLVKISHLLTELEGIPNRIPRVFIRGLDEYLHKLLGDASYNALNPMAEKLFEKITAEEDEEIWQEIVADEDYKSFAFSILMKMLVKFDNFYSGMTTFLSIVNGTINSLDDKKKGQGQIDIFTEEHFSLFFVTLFSDIFDILRDKEQALLLDDQFTKGTADRLAKIYESYVEHSSKLVEQQWAE